MKSAYELYMDNQAQRQDICHADCKDFIPLKGGGICKQSGKMVLADYLPNCRYKGIPKE